MNNRHFDSQQKPSQSRAPNLLKALMETRVLGEFFSLVTSWPQMLDKGSIKEGHGRPVIVYPGLATTDLSTVALRHFLTQRGYDVRPWGQGMNRGPRDGVMQTCADQLRRVNRETGQQVSLVGWSLGGLYARELAKSAPKRVRCVITLASPFAGATHSTNARQLYEFLSGLKVEDHPLTEGLHRAPLVPCTSIYTRSDGVVDWSACLDKPVRENKHVENIEVTSSHFGMVVNPEVLSLIADRLCEDPHAWRAYSEHENHSEHSEHSVHQAHPGHSKHSTHPVHPVHPT